MLVFIPSCNGLSGLITVAASNRNVAASELRQRGFNDLYMV